MIKKLFILTIMTLATTLLAADNWTLEKNMEGILIYNRPYETSKIKEYKGEVVLNTSVDKLVSYFKNTANHDKFLYKCKAGSVKMQKKVSENDFYTYMIIEVPWPATNRDIITRYQIGAADKTGTVTIDITGVKDLIPAVSGLVRVPEMKGYWKFVPQGNGQTKVIHQAYSKPGGNVPDALANNASVDAPFFMLKKLKEIFK